MPQISFRVKAADGKEMFSSEFQAEQPEAIDRVPNPSQLVRLFSETSDICVHLFRDGTARYAGNVTDNVNGVPTNRNLPIALPKIL